MGIRPCPQVTLPNEPLECEQRRQQLQMIDNIDFSLNLLWLFSNTQATFEEAEEICASSMDGLRFLTIEELELINIITLDDQPLCPMLVWATMNGDPALEFVEPNLESPNLVTPSPFSSPLCLAYVLCGRTF